MLKILIILTKNSREFVFDEIPHACRSLILWLCWHIIILSILWLMTLHIRRFIPMSVKLKPTLGASSRLFLLLNIRARCIVWMKVQWSIWSLIPNGGLTCKIIISLQFLLLLLLFDMLLHCSIHNLWAFNQWSMLIIPIIRINRDRKFMHYQLCPQILPINREVPVIWERGVVFLVFLGRTIRFNHLLDLGRSAFMDWAIKFI